MTQLERKLVTPLKEYACSLTVTCDSQALQPVRYMSGPCKICSASQVTEGYVKNLNLCMLFE